MSEAVGEARRWLSVEETATMLQVSVATIWRMVRSGRLAPHKLSGKSTRFDREEIDRAVAATRQEKEQTPC